MELLFVVMGGLRDLAIFVLAAWFSGHFIHYEVVRIRCRRCRSLRCTITPKSPTYEDVPFFVKVCRCCGFFEEIRGG